MSNIQNQKKLLHVVVMRFAIGVYDEVWLNHRFVLLSAITIPSLKKQNWIDGMFLLILVDQSISEMLLQKIIFLLKGLPSYIQKIDKHSKRAYFLKKFCEDKCININYSHILTTRIDDDDALSNYALNEINNAAKLLIDEKKSNYVISIKNEIRYLPHKNLALESNITVPAVAVSLLLDSDSEKNIFNFSHHKILDSNNNFNIFWINDINTKTLYTQHRMSDSNFFIRSFNILNSNKNYKFQNKDFERFNINEKLLNDWIKIDDLSPTLSVIRMTNVTKNNFDYSNFGKKSNKLLVELYIKIILAEQPEFIFEIGAREASFTKKASNLLPDCNFFLFEANSYSYTKFFNDFIKIKNVNYINCAISNVNDFNELFIPFSSEDKEINFLRGNTSLHKRLNKSVDYIKSYVPTLKLDNFINKLKINNNNLFTWIDVEGHGFEVLSGMKENLQKFNGIFIEIENKSAWVGAYTDKKIYNFLEDNDFYPLAKDQEYINQYNTIFLKKNIYKKYKYLVDKYLDAIATLE
jgi:FkbM family methyltransferase